jgi:hypothetical protein
MLKYINIIKIRLLYVYSLFIVSRNNHYITNIRYSYISIKISYILICILFEFIMPGTMIMVDFLFQHCSTIDELDDAFVIAEQGLATEFHNKAGVFQDSNEEDSLELYDAILSRFNDEYDKKQKELNQQEAN